MFRIIRETREEILRDFEMNKEVYFERIRETVKKFNGKAFLFGSYLKGEAIASSDVDVLIVVPSGVKRIEVLKELTTKISNPRFEFHVIHEDEAELYYKFFKPFRELA